MAIGILLLIALPVLRVALTTAVFLFEKDYLFAAISGAVLGIIALGFLLGTIKRFFFFWGGGGGGGIRRSKWSSCETRLHGASGC